MATFLQRSLRDETSWVPAEMHDGSLKYLPILLSFIIGYNVVCSFKYEEGKTYLYFQFQIISRVILKISNAVCM